MTRTPWPAVTAVALLLALSACATPTAQKPSAQAPAAPATPEAPTTVAAAPEAPEPALEPETQAIIESALAALTPPEPPMPEQAAIEAAPEPEIDDDPEQLMGLAAAELTELLGEPGFRREDADAQIWQYGGGDCALDIYLYRAGEAMPHRVTYYEFRGGAAGRLCLRSLLLAEAD